MTAAQSKSRHPSRGELLRRIDGELDDPRQHRLHRHLDGCARCRNRAAELEAQAKDAAAYVRALDVPFAVDRRKRERARQALRAALARKAGQQSRARRWAVAAAMVGLLLSSLAVDPVRAWVLERLPVGLAADRTPEVELVALPSAVVGVEGSVVSFSTTGSVFELHVDHPQRDGQIRLHASPTPRATAQITRAGAETLMVLPGGLRIENTVDARASYRVGIPSSTRRVTVSIGERTVEEVVVPEDPEGWTRSVPLGR